MTTTLRSKLIRLASANPSIRAKILPLLARRNPTAAMRIPAPLTKARNNTWILTFTFNAATGLTATAKNDQVNPNKADTWNKDQVLQTYRDMKKLVRTITTGGLIGASAGIADGAVAYLGRWSEQNAWSDDSGLVVYSDDPELAKLIATYIPHYFPVSGGGVPGSTSYRGNGWIARGPNEWVWHSFSFGIGD